MKHSGFGAYLVGSGYTADFGAYALGFGAAVGDGEPPVGDGVVSASPRSSPFNRSLREFPSANIREFPK